MPAPPSAYASLSLPGRRIISEIKRRSPSEGSLRDTVNPASLGRIYEDAGAAAISVLTAETHFGGHLDDLVAVSKAVSVPCLRKDFIVHDIQLLEARHAGASMVLLIVAALTQPELRDLIEAAEALEMDALVEVHTANEAKRAQDAGARIIGVNNRNLHTLDIDLATSEQIRPLLGSHVLPIAESGIGSLADLHRLENSGYHAFLIGSVLMKAQDPGRLLKSFLDPEPS